MQSQGGVKALKEKLYKLPEQLQRNRKILNEAWKGLKFNYKFRCKGVNILMSSLPLALTPSNSNVCWACIGVPFPVCTS